MLARTYFHAVAHRVCDLVGCGAALLVLHCLEAELSHPLLQCLPGNEATRFYGATELLDLFQDEQVRALLDIACQKGQVCFINKRRILAHGPVVEDVAIAPLAAPVGIAGYLVLTGACLGGFTPGDARLLESYLQTLLPEIERQVRELCGAEHSVAEGPVEQRIYPQANGKDPSSAAESVKADLISMVSHELRAPLTAIKGYAGLLQAYSLEDRQHENESGTIMTPARQQQYLDIIMDQAGHLELLMSDLLDVSRMQAGKLALHYTEVDVALLCQQAMRLAGQRIDETDRHRYLLRCEVSSELPPLRTDAHRLQQILSNLLDNAIKYSPGGGLIALQADIEYEPPNPPFCQPPVAWPMFHISIRDQGVGINAQQRARLFQPFSRLDHPLTGQVQGAGLGLFITHRLVEAMQGTIELTSQENKGTCITLRFPLQQPVEAPRPVLDAKKTPVSHP